MGKLLEGIKFHAHLAALWFSGISSHSPLAVVIMHSGAPTQHRQSASSALHSNGLRKRIRRPLPKRENLTHWNAFLAPLHSSSLLSSQNLQLSMQSHPTDLLSGKMRGRHHPPPPTLSPRPRISVFEMTPGVPDVQSFPEGCWRRVQCTESTKAPWLCKGYESPSIHHLEVDY